MDIWDSLQVLDGYFQDDFFICRGILGHAVYHRYTASDLRLFANVIREDKPFYFYDRLRTDCPFPSRFEWPTKARVAFIGG
ncbi:hypothetical protein A5N86_17215 [Geobacillus thermoleovorans]|uniref:hypothetical protein n=1 Tax=Geobacillus thermoleovorans TaxID=33941 RepID=UPI0008589C4F|nr:hypothetical protein [Geobacillus thermoleovorans]ODA14957.1 hypothetical protein A5N86_17215 [Geobacillus thermoleovorans]